MKEFLICVALSALSLQPIALNAQTSPNTVRWVATNKIATARGRVPLNNSKGVAPMTPAFEEYAFNTMLAKANEIREKWHLDIPKALTVDDVTFNLKPMANGFDGTLSSKPVRFIWVFGRSTLNAVIDTNYWPRSFRYNDEASAKLAKIKSQIDAKEAEALARKYLLMLGQTEKTIQLKEPPVVNQYKFEETDGTVYPLPLFQVAWDEVDRPEAKGGVVVFSISGVTKQVAQFEIADLHWPQTPMPTNYFDMLGVHPPANQRQRLGFEPCVPLTTTNGSATER